MAVAGNIAIAILIFLGGLAALGALINHVFFSGDNPWE